MDLEGGNATNDIIVVLTSGYYQAHSVSGFTRSLGLDLLGSNVIFEMWGAQILAVKFLGEECEGGGFVDVGSVIGGGEVC